MEPTMLARMTPCITGGDILEIYIGSRTSPKLARLVFKYNFVLPYETDSYDYRSVLDFDTGLPVSSSTGELLDITVHTALTPPYKQDMQVIGNCIALGHIPKWARAVVNTVVAHPIDFLLHTSK